MAKRERQQAQAQTQSNLNTSRQQTDSFTSAREDERTQARGQAGSSRGDWVDQLNALFPFGGMSSTEYGELQDWIRNLRQTAGYSSDPEQWARDRMTNRPQMDPERLGLLRGAGEAFLMSGGYDDPSLRDIQAGYAQLRAGGYDPTVLNGLAADYRTAGSTGGFDQAAYGRASAAFDPIVQTGGVDPTGIRQGSEMFRDIYASGGFNRGELQALRPRLQEFSRTGGISDRDAELMVRRGTGVNQSIYEAAANEIRRRNAMGGGGGDNSRLIRQAANQAAEVAVGAQGRVAEMRGNNRLAGLSAEGQLALGEAGLEQRGRVAGAEGFAGNETRLAALVQQGKLQGLSEQAAMARALAQLQQEGTFRGLGGQQQIATTQAQLQQQGLQAGTQGAAQLAADVAGGRRDTLAGLAGLESGVAERDMRYEQDAANLYANIQQQVARNNFTAVGQFAEFLNTTSNGRRAIADAQGRLAQMDQEAQVNLGREILERLRIGAQVNANDLALLAEMSKAPGLFDNIIRGVTAGAAAISAVTGGGGVTGGRP